MRAHQDDDCSGHPLTTPSCTSLSTSCSCSSSRCPASIEHADALARSGSRARSVTAADAVSRHGDLAQLQHQRMFCVGVLHPSSRTAYPDDWRKWYRTLPLECCWRALAGSKGYEQLKECDLCGNMV